MTYKARIVALPMAVLIALLTSLAWAQQSETEPAPAEPETASEDGPMTIPSSEAPIYISAERNRYDLRSGITEFNDDVNIERGPMKILADRGIFRQTDGDITEIELFGNPVEWRDQLEDGSVVNGEATNIFFDVAANVVTLTGNASIEHEEGRYTGDRLVYDLTNESLSGSSEGDNRVRVRIEPGALPEDN